MKLYLRYSFETSNGDYRRCGLTPVPSFQDGNQSLAQNETESLLANEQESSSDQEDITSSQGVPPTDHTSPLPPSDTEDLCVFPDDLSPTHSESMSEQPQTETQLQHEPQPQNSASIHSSGVKRSSDESGGAPVTSKYFARSANKQPPSQRHWAMGKRTTRNSHRRSLQ